MIYSKKDLDAVSIDLKDASVSEFYLLKRKHQMMIVIIFAIISFFILYWLLLSSHNRELSRLKSKEDSLRHTYSVNVEKLASMSTLQSEIDAINKSSASLLSQLPSDFSAANIVQEFYQAAAKNGLRINVNKYLKVQDKEVLIIRPYEIETTGTYRQLRQFCSDLSRLNTLVVLTDFRLFTKDNSSKELLHLKMIANTYQTKE